MTPVKAEFHGYTLLTGSTGSIGGYLLCDLLRARLPVAVLVRSSSTATAHQRIEKQLCRLEQRVGRHLLRPMVLEGDLCEPELGLSAQDKLWIATHCSRVLHSAASLSFAPANQHPANEPFRTNVQGTQRLLQVCRETNIQEFHYVSTAYTCGLHSGTVTETLHREVQDFANDYERSKAQAECELSDSPDLDSLTIYRPSIVVDPSKGASRQTDQAISKAFSTYQLLSSRFGLPEPGAWLKNLKLSGTECKNVVDAQWVARMIIQIFRRSNLHGKIYHLTSDVGTTVRTLEDGFRKAMVESSLGTKQQTQLATEPTSVDSSRLDKLAAPYVATFSPYFRDDPKFDQTNLRSVLKRFDEPPCPNIGVQEICRIATAQLQPPPSNSRVVNESEERVSVVWNTICQRLLGDSSRIDMSGKVAGEVGLLLTGPSGGQWTLRWNDDGVDLELGVPADATKTMYLSVETLVCLIRKTTSIAEACLSGRLQLECDQSDSPEWASECLQQLGALLAIDTQTLNSDAVTHVC